MDTALVNTCIIVHALDRVYCHMFYARPLPGSRQLCVFTNTSEGGAH